MASYNNKIEIENVPNFMTYNGKHLFHYTSFLSALKIILSEKLLFGDFKGMNDISESRREVFDDVAIVELNRYKSISFTKDKREKRGFEIDSLWGYYSEKGKGVCLVFNKAKLIMQLRKKAKFQRYGQIKYIKNFTNALFFEKGEESIGKQIEREYKNIFFTKSTDWRAENEYRFLIRSEQDNEDFLQYEDALIAVIICLPLTKSIIETCEYKMLKKCVNVPILCYHTSLGNKKLIDVSGKVLWPLFGVDQSLDI